MMRAPPSDGARPAEPEHRTTAAASSERRPLVSFCLLAYNQAHLVREAIAGAFAQTYKPLEVILSDDGSTDGTFEIMAEMAREYRGPHRIVLNRNPTNLGIGDHLNRLYHHLSHGELLVNAAGDDVSLPDRVEALYEAYRSHSPRPSLLYSNAVCIDVHGNELAPVVPVDVAGVHDRRPDGMAGGYQIVGCAAAVDRQLVSSFPPMRSGIMSEDVVLWRRAYLRHGVCYVPRVLVRYRVHPQALSQTTAWNRSRSVYVPMATRWVRDRALRFAQARADLAIARPSNAQAMWRSVARQERLNEFRRRVLTGTLLQGLFAVLSETVVTRRIPGEGVRAFLIRWLDIYRGREPTSPCAAAPSAGPRAPQGR